MKKDNLEVGIENQTILMVEVNQIILMVEVNQTILKVQY